MLTLRPPDRRLALRPDRLTAPLDQPPAPPDHPPEPPDDPPSELRFDELFELEFELPLEDEFDELFELEFDELLELEFELLFDEEFELEFDELFELEFEEPFELELDELFELEFPATLVPWTTAMVSGAAKGFTSAFVAAPALVADNRAADASDVMVTDRLIAFSMDIVATLATQRQRRTARSIPENSGRSA